MLRSEKVPQSLVCGLKCLQFLQQQLLLTGQDWRLWAIQPLHQQTEEEHRHVHQKKLWEWIQTNHWITLNDLRCHSSLLLSTEHVGPDRVHNKDKYWVDINVWRRLILTLPPAPHSLETDSRRAETCLAAAVPSSSASISFLSRASLSCCILSPSNLHTGTGTSQTLSVQKHKWSKRGSVKHFREMYSIFGPNHTGF